MRMRSKKVRGFSRRPGKRPTKEVKRDSVRVRVRFSPVKIDGRWYNSWVVGYYLNGQRKRERRNSERGAMAWADKVATKLANGQMEVLKLSGDDRRGYLNFIARLKPLKISLADAAVEYFGAKQIAGGEDLRDVATLRKKYGRVEVKPIAVPDLIEQMLTALEQDKRGDYHVRDLRVRLGRFAKDFPGQISEIKFSMIEKWLRELRSLAKGSRRGGVLKGRSRNNYRNAIGELFNYARKNGYLPKDLPTEASDLARVSEEDARENEIFTPEQLVELLNEAHPRLIASMAINSLLKNV